MNEKLNLVEILKDCPKGMELDCTMFDNAKFVGVKNYEKAICIRIGDMYLDLTQYGTWNFDENAKCIIFPKGKTTWEGFVPPCEFKDGDILSYQNARFSNRTIYIYRYHERFNTSYYVALSGDDNEFRIDNKGAWALNGYNETVRFATEEEKQKLFKAIKDNGYKWNAETKTLEKLVEPKFKVGDIVRHKNIRNVWFTIRNLEEDSYFCSGNLVFLFDDQDEYELVSDKFDPKNLNAFDKVLVRYNNTDYWRCDFFSHELDGEGVYKYACIKSVYKRCIPYNDDTKHLLGTSDETQEYYRYWED